MNNVKDPLRCLSYTYAKPLAKYIFNKALPKIVILEDTSASVHRASSNGRR